MNIIETERLKLRMITRDDVTDIYNNWANDSEVTKYLTWSAHQDISVTHAIMDYWLEEYKKENCYRYGVERKTDGELMGMIDVVGYHHGNPVIGYCMGKKYWNCGYMTEALKAVTEELISEGYKEIVVEAVNENIGSNRVIIKNGYEFVTSRDEILSELKPQIMTINSYRYYAEKLTDKSKTSV